MAFGYDGSIRIDSKINSKGFNSGISSMGNALKKLAGMVGLAFGAAAIVNFGKESVKAASSLSSALIGLQSIVEGQGKSFSQAQEFIKDYIKDGLVPLENAVTAYKNLLMRGYDTEQIEQTLIALKNSATFGRQASLTMGQAVASATEGLKNENSILVDNAGVTKNVSVMWKEYADSIGVGVQSLTKQQKIQAEVNGILHETRFQTGDAAKAVDTYAGQVAMLSFNLQQLKVAVGNAIIPMIQAAIPAVNTLISSLTSLANVFAQVTTAMFGMKEQAKADEELEDSNDDTAESAGDLADATEEVGKATEKAAKKVKGSLAPFDDLKKISASTADSLEDTADDINEGLDLEDMGEGSTLWGNVEVSSEVLEFLEKVKSNLSDIISKLKSIAELFIFGFEVGSGNLDFSSISNSVEGISSQLKKIFTDADVTTAAQNLAEHFLTALGAVVGAVTSIGSSLAMALFGGINQFLEERGEDIKQWIIRMFDVGTEIADIIEIFSVALTDIFTVFRGEEAQQIIADALSIFSSIFMGAMEIMAKLGQDILDVMTTPIIANKDKIKEAVEGALGPLSTIVGAIEQLVRDAVGKVVSMYDEHIHPFLMKVKDSFTEWQGHLLDGWNTNVGPVFDELATKFAEIADKYIGPTVESIITAFGKVYDLLSALWDLISPIITEMIDNLMPILADALSVIGNVLLDVLATVSSVAGGIFDALGGVLDFLTGVFTGDWEKAWEGITGIFTGAFNVVVSVLEGAINLIVDGVNFLISQLNKIHIDTPDWLTELTGIDGFGFNIAPVKRIELPKLANGAVIPPNQQFAAILGDQRSGTNIEAPLSVIEQAVRNVVGEQGGIVEIHMEMPVNLDGREIYRNQQVVRRQMGTSFVKVGS